MAAHGQGHRVGGAPFAQGRPARRRQQRPRSADQGRAVRAAAQLSGVPRPGGRGGAAERAAGAFARKSIAPTDDTVPTHQRFQEAAAPSGLVAPAPVAIPKPHISLDDIPSSTSLEVLKWLFFFALFLVTAAVAFWFF